MIRFVLALVGASILVFSPFIAKGSSGDIAIIYAAIASTIFFPIAGIGAIGGLLGIWKRKLGGGMMLGAGLFGLTSVFVGEYWGLLGAGLLIGCGLSSLWIYIK
jgi:hypothetical protein